jgi:hypothetical protein
VGIAPLILKQAIRAVPAVKWALGVAGIIAVIAIVKGGLKISPLVAVFGTVVMVLLMVLLVVFAKLSVGSAGDFRLPILVLTWASIALTVFAACFLFTSVFFDWPINFHNSAVASGKPLEDSLPDLACPELKHVWDVQDRIMAVRATWEVIPTTGEINRQRVMELAPKYGDEMLNIPDEKACLRGQLLKYQYACYAFVVSADTEPDKAHKTEFAKTAISSCDKANAVIDTAVQASSTDKKAKTVADFARSDDAAPRINYLSAMATCLYGNAVGDQRSQQRVLEILGRIPSYYKQRFPPEKDSVLKQCSMVQASNGGR